MSIKTGNGSEAWLAGNTTDFAVDFVTAPLTLTNATQAVQFVGGDASYVKKIDLKGYTQARLVGFVKTVSDSTNTPKIAAKYHTSYSSTASDYSALGQAGGVEFSIFTGATEGDSGWVTIAEAAKVNDCYVALMAVGGDGAADPVINQVTLYLR